MKEALTKAKQHTTILLTGGTWLVYLTHNTENLTHNI
jgi:hypothetical protein